MTATGQTERVGAPFDIARKSAAIRIISARDSPGIVANVTATSCTATRSFRKRWAPRARGTVPVAVGALSATPDPNLHNNAAVGRMRLG